MMKVIGKIILLLVVSVLLVSMTACNRSAGLPPAEKVYLATADNAHGASADNQAERYLVDIDALTDWVATQERTVLLDQASQMELDWLKNAGFPDEVLWFFSHAEPQNSLESAGVFLEPVSLLIETISKVTMANVAYQFGCVIIAKTISGDFYCLDVLQAREDGTSAIYLVNHDKINEVMAFAEFWQNSYLVSYSFSEFLDKFMARSLPYVYAQAWELGNVNRSRDGYDAYVDEHGRFQLRYPDTWLITSPANVDDQVSFINPSLGAQTNRVMLTILVQKPTKNLVRLANTAEQSMRQQPGVTNFRQNSQMIVEVNGLPGIEKETSYTINNISLSQRTLYLTHPDFTFVLNFMAPGEDQTKHNATFKKIIRSFIVP